jgi:hypothetical protein
MDTGSCEERASGKDQRSRFWLHQGPQRLASRQARNKRRATKKPGGKTSGLFRCEDLRAGYSAGVAAV